MKIPRNVPGPLLILVGTLFVSASLIGVAYATTPGSEPKSACEAGL